MKVWIVRDTCWECPGEALHVASTEEKARAWMKRSDTPWATVDEVEVDE
ncbi:hypothetical protein [Streptomyces microflavus]